MAQQTWLFIMSIKQKLKKIEEQITRMEMGDMDFDAQIVAYQSALDTIQSLKKTIDQSMQRIQEIPHDDI